VENKTLAKAYEPKVVEASWYADWLKSGYFHAPIDQEKRPYTIVIPPPNVTGSLHIGHAFNNTLQDIVIRKKRMEGYSALWLPGTDHAGIATQNVVERELAKEGLTRQDIGREAFVERVWEWKQQYGETIISQLKRLGCSCDWDRERFTMDEDYSRAVRVVFKKLYDDGLIYRGSYIINWCPRCRTALSDIEVEHEDVQGKLWYIRYPFKDGSGFLTVATTRPETMLGDTAVAVNPEDKRYLKVIGATVILPLLNREIPVIADDFVDPSFGTGAVKVTPSHDPNDFDMGLRHDLPQVNIFTEEAVLNENAGPYAGLDRYKGREAVLKDLVKDGFLEKDEEHAHAVGHCYRCHTVVEPYQSLQWFVKMKPLAEPAIKIVRDGETKFHPKRWEKLYFEWMENIRDWCISRQLWWGHRIPVWYCAGCGESIVAIDDPAACPKCGGTDLKQDEDVLDTWFSSWLWPFATMGWPENTADLEYFYPTSLLSTAFDIIFFWVARMIMAGLYFTGETPFKDVYVHALIRDAHGQKMSKSRGNVIDPLDVIEWSGTDALRFTLASLAVPGRDVILSEDRIEGYRHFVNKLWNASRFVLMNLEGYNPVFVPDRETLTVADRWILSRLAEVTRDTDKNLETYNFSEACRALYAFVWGDYCDWYIEWSKNRLNGSDRAIVQYVLANVLETVLRLLHPVIPFVTEEIRQKLPGVEGTIMLASWPHADKGLIDKDAEVEATLIIEATTAIRQIKHDLKLSPKKPVDAVFVSSDSRKIGLIKDHEEEMRMLAGLGKITYEQTLHRQGQAAKAVVGGIELYIPLAGLVDLEKEKSRLESEIENLGKDLEKARAKLGNEGFVKKAAPEIVQKVKDAESDLTEKQEKLKDQLGLLSS
jgi:valyl-tRNA synthetase